MLECVLEHSFILTCALSFTRIIWALKCGNHLKSHNFHARAIMGACFIFFLPFLQWDVMMKPITIIGFKGARYGFNYPLTTTQVWLLSSFKVSRQLLMTCIKSRPFPCSWLPQQPSPTKGFLSWLGAHRISQLKELTKGTFVPGFSSFLEELNWNYSSSFPKELWTEL